MANDVINTWKNRAKNDVYGLSGKAHFILNLFVDFIAGKTEKSAVVRELKKKSKHEKNEYNYFTEALQDLECIC